ncbi:hypothetical protein SNEBB_008670 [Seison nebaliae]|nr:hypothetical protein SNEBB_008670 [Seison nebaliae]
MAGKSKSPRKNSKRSSRKPSARKTPKKTPRTESRKKKEKQEINDTNHYLANYQINRDDWTCMITWLMPTRVSHISFLSAVEETLQRFKRRNIFVISKDTLLEFIQPKLVDKIIMNLESRKDPLAVLLLEVSGELTPLAATPDLITPTQWAKLIKLVLINLRLVQEKKKNTQQVQQNKETLSNKKKSQAKKKEEEFTGNFSMFVIIKDMHHPTILEILTSQFNVRIHGLLQIKTDEDIKLDYAFPWKIATKENKVNQPEMHEHFINLKYDISTFWSVMKRVFTRNEPKFLADIVKIQLKLMVKALSLSSFKDKQFKNYFTMNVCQFILTQLATIRQCLFDHSKYLETTRFLTFPQPNLETLSKEKIIAEIGKEGLHVSEEIKKGHGQSNIIDMLPKIDMQYYRKSLELIPFECQSIPLILNSIVEQVVVTKDELNDTLLAQYDKSNLQVERFMAQMIESMHLPADKKEELVGDFPFQRIKRNCIKNNPLPDSYMKYSEVLRSTIHNYWDQSTARLFHLSNFDDKIYKALDNVYGIYKSPIGIERYIFEHALPWNNLLINENINKINILQYMDERKKKFSPRVLAHFFHQLVLEKETLLEKSQTNFWTNPVSILTAILTETAHEELEKFKRTGISRNDFRPKILSDPHISTLTFESASRSDTIIQDSFALEIDGSNLSEGKKTDDKFPEIQSKPESVKEFTHHIDDVSFNLIINEAVKKLNERNIGEIITPYSFIQILQEANYFLPFHQITSNPMNDTILISLFEAPSSDTILYQDEQRFEVVYPYNERLFSIKEKVSKQEFLLPTELVSQKRYNFDDGNGDVTYSSTEIFKKLSKTDKDDATEKAMISSDKTNDSDYLKHLDTINNCYYPPLTMRATYHEESTAKKNIRFGFIQLRKEKLKKFHTSSQDTLVMDNSQEIDNDYIGPNSLKAEQGLKALRRIEQNDNPSRRQNPSSTPLKQETTRQQTSTLPVRKEMDKETTRQSSGKISKKMLKAKLSPKKKSSKKATFTSEVQTKWELPIDSPLGYQMTTDEAIDFSSKSTVLFPRNDTKIRVSTNIKLHRNYITVTVLKNKHVFNIDKILPKRLEEEEDVEQSERISRPSDQLVKPEFSLLYDIGPFGNNMDYAYRTLTNCDGTRAPPISETDEISNILTIVLANGINVAVPDPIIDTLLIEIDKDVDQSQSVYEEKIFSFLPLSFSSEDGLNISIQQIRLEKNDNERFYCLKMSYDPLALETDARRFLKKEIARYIDHNGNVTITHPHNTIETLMMDGTRIFEFSFTSIIEPVEVNRPSMNKKNTKNAGKPQIEEVKEVVEPQVITIVVKHVIFHDGQNYRYIPTVYYPVYEKFIGTVNEDFAYFNELIPGLSQNIIEKSEDFVRIKYSKCTFWNLTNYTKCIYSQRRSDNVLRVYKFDGANIVEYPNGTRITSAIDVTDDRQKYRRIECPGFPTIMVNLETSEFNISFRNRTNIFYNPKQLCSIFLDDGDTIEINGLGDAMYIPKEKITEFQEESSTNLQEMKRKSNSKKVSGNIYFAKSENFLVKTTDQFGISYIVTDGGECQVEENMMNLNKNHKIKVIKKSKDHYTVSEQQSVSDESQQEKDSVTVVTRNDQQIKILSKLPKSFTNDLITDNSNELTNFHSPRIFQVNNDGTIMEWISLRNLEDYLYLLKNSTSSFIEHKRDEPKDIKYFTTLRKITDTYSDRFILPYAESNIISPGLKIYESLIQMNKNDTPLILGDYENAFVQWREERLQDESCIIPTNSDMQYFYETREFCHFPVMSDEIRQMFSKALLTYLQSLATNVTKIYDSIETNDIIYKNETLKLFYSDRPDGVGIRDFNKMKNFDFTEKPVKVVEKNEVSQEVEQQRLNKRLQLEKERAELLEQQRINRMYLRQQKFVNYWRSEFGRAYLENRDITEELAQLPGRYSPEEKKEPIIKKDKKFCKKRLVHRKIRVSASDISGDEEDDIAQIIERQEMMRRSHKKKENNSKEKQIPEGPDYAGKIIKLMKPRENVRYLSEYKEKEESHEDLYETLGKTFTKDPNKSTISPHDKLSEIETQMLVMSPKERREILYGKSLDGRRRVNPLSVPKSIDYEVPVIKVNNFKLHEDDKIRHTLPLRMTLEKAEKLHGILVHPKIIDFGYLREEYHYIMKFSILNNNSHIFRFRVLPINPLAGVYLSYKPNWIAPGMKKEIIIHCVGISSNKLDRLNADFSQYTKWTKHCKSFQDVYENQMKFETSGMVRDQRKEQDGATMRMLKSRANICDNYQVSVNNRRTTETSNDNVKEELNKKDYRKVQLSICVESEDEIFEIPIFATILSEVTYNEMFASDGKLSSKAKNVGKTVVSMTNLLKIQKTAN